MASIQNTIGDKGSVVGWRWSDGVYLPAHLAATATESFALWVAGFKAQIGQVAIINSNAAVTGQDTNTTHINLVDGGAEGAGTTERANRDLVSGTDIPVGKTLLYDNTTSPFELDQGDILEIQYEKVANGLLVPTLMYMVLYRGAASGV